MKRTKRTTKIVIAFLSLCILAGVIPAIVMNAGAADVNASDWSSVVTGLQTANTTVHLSADITSGFSSISVASGTTLDMNGHNITYTANDDTQNGSSWAGYRPANVAGWIAKLDSTDAVSELFNVASGRTFTITGSGKITYSNYSETSGKNNNDYWDNARIVKNEGTFNLYEAELYCYAEQNCTGGYVHSAAGIAVPIQNNGGTVNIYSGTVGASTRANGNSYKGSASGRYGMAYCDALSIPVYSATGTVNMYGGTLWSTSKGDNNNGSSSGGNYDGEYGSECAYSVCVDCQGDGQFNMYGGIIRNDGAYDYNDKEDDGLHYSIAFGVNYTGTNIPKIVAGQITTSYVSGQSAMTSKTNVGSVTCSKADIGKVTLGLSTDGANDGTVSYDTNAQWINEYGKVYTKTYTALGNGSGQTSSNTVNDTALYGGMTDGKKVRVIYRIYNNNGNRKYTDEYFGQYTAMVLSSTPSLTGLTLTGSTTSNSAGGEWKYSNSCGTGSCSYVNTCYVDSCSIKYLKQKCYDAYPDLNTAGSAGAATTLDTDDIMYIFVDLTLRKQIQPVMTLTGASFEYQGGTILPAVSDSDGTFNTTDGDFGIRIEQELESEGRSDITTSLFGWKTGVTGKQDVKYSYTGTSSGSGLPTEPGEYTITAELDATGSNWSTYPAATGANIYYVAKSCDITIKKRTPVLTATTKTLTYGQTLGNVYGFGSTIPTGVTFSSNTRIACSPTGEYHWYNTDGECIDEAILNAGQNQTVYLRWTPSGAWSDRFNEKEIAVTLNINKAPLTIAANNLTMQYGDTRQFTYDDFSWSGIVNTAVDSKGSIFNEINSLIQVNGNNCNINKFLETETSILNGVGSYNWGFSAISLNNYQVTVQVGTMTVISRQITAEAYAVTKTYDGNNNVVIKFNGPDDTVAQMESIGISDAYGISASSDVGSTTVTAVYSNDTRTNKITSDKWSTLLTGAKKSNYTLSIINDPNNDGVINATITKAEPVLVIPTLSSSVYDHSKSLVDHFGENFDYNMGGTSGHWEWVDPTEIPTVSQTTARAKFVPDHPENYDEAQRDINITITKREITISATASDITYYDPMPVITYQFSGFTDTEAMVGYPESASGYYNNGVDGLSGNLTMSNSYYQGADAGNYVITLTSTLTSDNYSFVTTSGCSFNVNKAVLNVKANDRSIVYGTTNPGFTKTVSGFLGDDSFEIINGYSAMGFSCSYQAGREYGGVGTYDITPIVSTLSATNYTFTATSGILTVTKATLIIKASDLTIGYGEAAIGKMTYEVSGLVGGDTNSTAFKEIANAALVAEDYSVDDVNEIYSDAGTYTIAITDTDWITSTNYEIETENGILTVTQAATEIIINTLKVSIDYEQTLEDAVFSGNIIASSHGIYCDGTFAFEDPSIQPSFTDRCSADGGNGTKYTIIFTPSDINCRPVTVQVEITINRRAVEGTPLISGVIMDTSTVSADVSSMVPANASRYFYEWSIDGVVVGTDETYTIQSSNVGKYLTLTVTVDSSYPYDGSATTTSDYPISEFLPTITDSDVLTYFDVDWANKVYDGTENVATATSKGVYGVGAATVRYNNSLTAPTDAGTYRITIDIGQGEAYAPSTGLYIGEMTISKRELGVTFGVNDKQYDAKVTATRDTSVEIGLVNLIEDDDVTVSFDAAKIEFANANVGENKKVTVTGVIALGADKNNYTVAVDDSVTASITPKTVTAKARPVARTYDPDDDTISVTFTALSGVLSADKGKVAIGSYEATLKANDAGTQNVDSITAELTGEMADNYVLSITNLTGLTAVINKAEATEIPGFTVPTLETIEYNGQTLRDITLPSNWAWTTPGTKVSVTATSYGAVYTPTDTTNYKTYAANISMKTTKRTLTVTYNSYTATYGDDQPTFEYVITGYAKNEGFTSFGGAIATTCSYVKNSNIGVYEITNSPATTFYNVNYDINYVPGTLTVYPKEISATGSTTNRTYRAGVTSVDVTYVLDNSAKVRSNDDVYLSWNYGTGNLPDANAGYDRPVTVTPPTLSGSSAGNYTLVFTNSTLTVDIAKASPTGYTFPTAAKVFFGKTLSTATFTSPGSGDGTFAFADADSTPAAVGYFPNQYDVIFTPTDTNYNTVTKRIPLTVERSSIAPYVEIVGSYYVGETLSANIIGLTGTAYNYIHYSWMRISGGAEIAIGTDSSTYELTDDDVGYEIKVNISIDETAPYYFSATASTTAAQTTKSIQQENLTFTQKIIKWWNNLLTAIRRLLGIF